MGTITSKIADEIKLHGSWENAQAFNEEQARKWMNTEKPKSLLRPREPVLTHICQHCGKYFDGLDYDHAQCGRCGNAIGY
jgi:hypothetical protein